MRGIQDGIIAVIVIAIVIVTAILDGRGAAQSGDVGQGVDPPDETPEEELEAPRHLEFAIITALFPGGRDRPAGAVPTDQRGAIDRGPQGDAVRGLTHARGDAPNPEPELGPALVPGRGSLLAPPARGREARIGLSSGRAPSPKRASYDRPPTLTRMRRKHGSKNRYERGKKKPRRIWPRKSRRERRACPCPVSTSSLVAIAVSAANDRLI